MSESIVSNEKVCFRCRTTQNLAKHHNMSDKGIHFDHEYDTEIKQMCQEEWEKRNGDRAAFIRVFGKSYL